ncbi:MAG TPA: hypothetical protein VEV41_11465 [Terriglobales bacterium]|nr:hypothetical protein [Terriglobales bacterium]
MKIFLTTPLAPLLLLASPILTIAQVEAPQPPSAQAPVSYASVTQLNNILSQVEQTSQSAQVDLARLRIEKWKTDSNSKRQAQSNVEALARNMKTALPEVITQLRNSPEDLSATFKLYRNLDALYDVFGSVVESAGAFGSREEYQSLAADMDSFEKARRELAERMENLTGAKENELSRLRTQLKAAQAAPPPPAKKIVVDDTEPPKKPAKKKAVPKTKPATGQPAPTPPAQPAPQNSQTPQ